MSTTPTSGGPVSPINPPSGAQSGDYVVVMDPVEDPVLLGTPKQIVYVGGTTRLGAFGRETVERYHVANGQGAAARAFMDDCLKDQTCMDCERTKVQGDNTEITVTWAYDREDETWSPGSDADQWDFDVMDTSQSLRSHPYFGRRITDSTDGEDLLREMGACDQKMALGKDYWLDPQRIASPSALVSAVMARYAGLRAAGVEEWQPVFIMLQCRYRLFPSQINPASQTDAYNWATLLNDVNRVVSLDDWNPPEYIASVVSGIEELVYPDDGGTFPTANPGGFVWIRQKPQIRLSGKNPNGPCDVVDFLLGMQQASAVLTPALRILDNAELWDPKRNVDDRPPNP